MGDEGASDDKKAGAVDAHDVAPEPGAHERGGEAVEGEAPADDDAPAGDAHDAEGEPGEPADGEDAHPAEYAEGEDPSGPGEHAAEGEYPEGEYPEGEYPEGAYAESQYAEGQYPEGEHPEGQYTEGEYAEGQYAEGDHPQGDYAEGEYAEGEYPEGEYPAGEGEPALAAPASVRGRPMMWLLVAVPLVLAAFAVLFMATRGAAGDDLPTYEVTGPAAPPDPDPALLGKATEILLDPDGNADIVLKPDQPAAKMGARVVLLAGSPPTPSPWPGTIDVASDGAIKLGGKAKALFPETKGVYEIVIVAAKADSLPSDIDAARIATGVTNPPTSRRLVRARVRFAEKK